MSKKTSETSVLTLSVIGSLVLVNVLALGLFWRLDLTEDKRFTLSEATKNTLENLEDPVTVRAYFSEDLPPPFNQNARYVKDLLEEYYAHAGGQLRYEFIDPISEETDADKEKKKEVKQDIFGRQVREKTSVEAELERLGIPPVQVRVNEDDKMEVKRAYMGIAIRYREGSEVIPVVQSTDGLEYDLTAAIRKMAREKTPKVAIVQGHEGPDPQKGLAQVQGLLTQTYDVTTVDLTQEGATIPEDVDALMVVGPKTAFSPAEQKALDQFVMAGKPAAFLLGNISPDLRTLEQTPNEHGLGDMIATWGVRIGDGLVLDVESATLNVTQQRGFMRIAQPVQYPYIPLPQRLDPDHPLTRGISQVSFPFMAPLTITSTQDSGVKAQAIVKSSSEGWVASAPFDLNPMQRWTQDRIGEQGVQNLVVVLEGQLPSHFASAAESTPEGETPILTQAENARVLVAGGHAFVTDDFLSPGNQALLLNLFDWLLQDEALLAVRSRGLGAAPLDSEISDAKKGLIKYGNILGLPLAFAIFGVVRRLRREARRKSVSV